VFEQVSDERLDVLAPDRRHGLGHAVRGQVACELLRGAHVCRLGVGAEVLGAQVAPEPPDVDADVAFGLNGGYGFDARYLQLLR